MIYATCLIVRFLLGNPHIQKTMNDKDNAVYQALGRVNRFGVTHAAAFPAGSNAVAGFARAI